MKHKTQVFLVGAGPGDTGLITVKGLQCLQKADVVLYDNLSNPALLQNVPDDAELIYVGKSKNHHSMQQHDINNLLVTKAQQGKIVVRLKGGDPYIFGRGGEEALRLAEAEITFDVVPGITSGFAASCYAGIPLTHRDFTTSVSLITGHVKTKNRLSDINWSSHASSNSTLVFYMGLSNIRTICQQLIQFGRKNTTPVAIISRGTTINQQTVITSLADAPQKVIEHNVQPPALIIVGEVVTLRQQLRWFEDKPLFGQRILVPYTISAPSAMCEQLNELGAETIRLKVTTEQPPSSWTELDQAIEQLPQVGILILRSPSGVNGLWQRLEATGKDARHLNNISIISCGSKTTAALRNKGIIPDKIISFKQLQLELPTLSKIHPGKHILALRNERDAPNQLQQYCVDKVINEPMAYRTSCNTKQRNYLLQLLQTQQLTTLCLTSVASTTALINLIGERDEDKATQSPADTLAHLYTIAMGESIGKTATNLGISIDATNVKVIDCLLQHESK